MSAAPDAPLLRIRDATVAFGDRVLFEGLDLDVGAGEFLAVLGPNGAGKTTLLRALLGTVALTRGTIETVPVNGTGAPPPVGYVPQQHAFEPDVPVRGRDLVRLGLDGHRPGPPLRNRQTRERVDAALAAVGALGFADLPIGRLSGGEQQRLRIAQALVTDPQLLLCDEPLLSLDLAQQRVVSALIDERRRRAGTAVVFVTHEINPVQQYVDRVLYLVEGRWATGTADEVLTSERLSDLYGTEIDVVRLRDRIVVVGADDHHHHLEPGPRRPGPRDPGATTRGGRTP